MRNGASVSHSTDPAQLRNTTAKTLGNSTLHLVSGSPSKQQLQDISTPAAPERTTCGTLSNKTATQALGQRATECGHVEDTVCQISNEANSALFHNMNWRIAEKAKNTVVSVTEQPTRRPKAKTQRRAKSRSWFPLTSKPSAHGHYASSSHASPAADLQSLPRFRPSCAAR